MEAKIIKEDDRWVSPECVNEDGSLIKFVHRDYLIRYLRYLREKNNAEQ